MSQKSNVFGTAHFPSWTKDQVTQFVKCFNEMFGSQNLVYYLDFEEPLSDNKFSVHGEGNFSIKNTLRDIKKYMTTHVLSNDWIKCLDIMTQDDLAVYLDLIEEENSTELLESSYCRLTVENGVLVYRTLRSENYPYTRENLVKFDLYDEFEVNEDEFMDKVITKYPNLSKTVIHQIKERINIKPHSSEQSLLDDVEHIIEHSKIQPEPLYEVILPLVRWDSDASELETHFGILRYNLSTDETQLVPYDKNFDHLESFNPDDNWQSQLTEEQLKSIDKKYWLIAEPVEIF